MAASSDVQRERQEVKGREIHFLAIQRETVKQKRKKKTSRGHQIKTYSDVFFFCNHIGWDSTIVFDRRFYWQLCGEMVSIYGWKENKLLQISMQDKVAVVFRFENVYAFWPSNSFRNAPCRYAHTRAKTVAVNNWKYPECRTLNKSWFLHSVAFHAANEKNWGAPSLWT